MRPTAVVLVLMGVAGAGKSTIGRLLATELGWPFYDADDFHPAANLERMRCGIALSDEDREPWLSTLERLIAQVYARGESAVLACSALKAAYRTRLRAAAGQQKMISFAYLRISPATASLRLQRRRAHFMPAALLPSQFAVLEEPEDAWIIDAEQPPQVILAQIREQIGAQGFANSRDYR